MSHPIRANVTYVTDGGAWRCDHESCAAEAPGDYKLLTAVGWLSLNDGRHLCPEHAPAWRAYITVRGRWLEDRERHIRARLDQARRAAEAEWDEQHPKPELPFGTADTRRRPAAAGGGR